MGVTEVLLYSAQDAHDVLGHWIGRLERGTFTHAALLRELDPDEHPNALPRRLIVEAVWPRVRVVSWPDQVDKAVAGASQRVPLEPVSAQRDRRVWNELLGSSVVGSRYSIPTLVTDALGVWLGHPVVLRLGGTVVCSLLVARYGIAVGDPRFPVWAQDVDQVSPADLGQWLVGRRTKPPSGTEGAAPARDYWTSRP